LARFDPGASCKHRCKLWYELINSRSFVDKNLRFNIQNHNNSLFLKWTRMLDDIFFDLLSKRAQEVQSLLTISKDESDSSVSLSLVPKKLDILAAFLLIPREKQERLAVLCNPALKIFPSNFDFGFGFEAAGEGAAAGLYLPEEIVEDIVLRSSPESVMVCKCVCKLWYDLINSRSFVDKHLRFNIQKQRSNNNNSVYLFLKWTRQELSEHEIFIDHLRVLSYHANDLSKQVLSLVTISMDDDDADDAASSGDVLPSCIIEQVSLPPSVVEKISVKKLININQKIENFAAIHCHGIICLFDEQRRSSLVLCNPALRIFKIFHPPRPFGFRSLGLGFGYDPRANVYKLVRIYGSMDPNEQVTRAMVYTLGTDTDSWREIVAPKQYCYLYPKGVYCRGVFYWWDLISRCSTIVSFDMSKEEFHFIPAPDDAVGENRKMHELALWNESVVIFFSTEFSWFSTSFEMWVMVDSPSGYGTYWRKHLTIGPLARIYSPLEF
ncbi:F-box domain containing protein, partial [Trema orientale]